MLPPRYIRKFGVRLASWLKHHSAAFPVISYMPNSFGNFVATLKGSDAKPLFPLFHAISLIVLLPL